MTKYIIIYPRAGLNDIMNKIHDAYLHALKYNRILVIDTRCDAFSDDIRKYFTFNSDIIYSGDLDLLYQSFKDKTIFPGEDRDIISLGGNSRYNCNNSMYYYNGVLLTIDLNIDYSEDILIYSACGGGRGIIEMLKIISLSSCVLDVFNSRRMQLPESYISVHIRNTDIPSDIDQFIDTYSSEFATNVFFLASDHLDTINRFRKLYGNNLYSFSNVPEVTGGKNIHYNHKSIDNKEFNIDTIVDFLLLAAGDKIYVSTYKSGYSRSAVELNKNKDILNNLIMNVRA